MKICNLVFECCTAEDRQRWLEIPLECALNRGDYRLVKRLGKAGANIGNAVHTAVREGDDKLVKKLLDMGVYPSGGKWDGGHGETPLHVAAELGRANMMSYLLLLKGADPDMLDRRNYTPLFRAAEKGHESAVRVLLAAGADMHIRCGSARGYGSRRISSFNMVARRGLTGVLRVMVQGGVDVDAAPCAYGVTALHSAASTGTVEAICMLVEAGASIEARNAGGNTPLLTAVNFCNLDAADALLNHGASVNTRNNNQETPLRRAVSCERECAVGMVDLLLRKGADETIVDHLGLTPMDVVEGKILACEALVDDSDDFHFRHRLDHVSAVRDILTSAPADRAWRRRGFLVLCRAQPDKMVLKHDRSRVPCGRVPTTRSRVQRAKPQTRGAGSGVGCGGGGGAGGNSHDACIGDKWPHVVTKVLKLEEEFLFRMIVEYL